MEDVGVGERKMSEPKKNRARSRAIIKPPRASEKAIVLWNDLEPQSDEQAAENARYPKVSKFVVQYRDIRGREFMKATENVNGEISFFVRLPKKEHPTDIPASFPMPNDTIIISPIHDPELEHVLTVLSMEGHPGPRTKQLKITVVTNDIY